MGSVTNRVVMTSIIVLAAFATARAEAADVEAASAVDAVTVYPDGSSRPLTELAAFQEFTREVGDRCDEPPVVLEASEIGRFLDP